MSWSDYFLPAKSMTADEQAANLAKTQALMAQRIAERDAAGTLTNEQIAASYNAALAVTTDSQDAAAADGFVEGAKDGLNNVLQAPGQLVGAVGDGASTMLWSVVKNIPWWVYVGAGVGLFLWMGGLALIRGRLAKAA